MVGFVGILRVIRYFVCIHSFVNPLSNITNKLNVTNNININGSDKANREGLPDENRNNSDNNNSIHQKHVSLDNIEGYFKSNTNC